MRFVFLIIIAAALAFGVAVLLAGEVEEVDHNSVKRLTFTLVGDSDTVRTTGYFDGRIVQVTVDPTWGDAPADNFDLTVLDDNSLDQIFGYGANLDSASTTTLLDSLGYVTASRLKASVSNMGGAGDSVKIYLWLR